LKATAVLNYSFIVRQAAKPAFPVISFCWWTGGKQWVGFSSCASSLFLPQPRDQVSYGRSGLLLAFYDDHTVSQSLMMFLPQFFCQSSIWFRESLWLSPDL